VLRFFISPHRESLILCHLLPNATAPAFELRRDGFQEQRSLHLFRMIPRFPWSAQSLQFKPSAFKPPECQSIALSASASNLLVVQIRQLMSGRGQFWLSLFKLNIWAIAIFLVAFVAI
jgi:hypothetical protein